MKTQIAFQMKDSYLIRKKEVETSIKMADLCKKNPESILNHRSMFSMKMEWATHKMLYKLGIQRDRTKDLDLDWPQPWYMRVGYIIAGILSWPFIR